MSYVILSLTYVISSPTSTMLTVGGLENKTPWDKSKSQSHETNRSTLPR